jgi:hypothetical protein
MTLGAVGCCADEMARGWHAVPTGTPETVSDLRFCWLPRLDSNQ